MLLIPFSIFLFLSYFFFLSAGMRVMVCAVTYQNKTNKQKQTKPHQKPNKETTLCALWVLHLGCLPMANSCTPQPLSLLFYILCWFRGYQVGKEAVIVPLCLYLTSFLYHDACEGKACCSQRQISLIFPGWTVSCYSYPYLTSIIYLPMYYKALSLTRPLLMCNKDPLRTGVQTSLQQIDLEYLG